MNRRATAAQRAESLERLREYLPPGTPVYVIQRHVSRSGMMRRLTLHIIRPDRGSRHPGQPYLLNITWHVANVLGWSLNDNNELRVDGAGMDMHFHTVYSLGRHLYPNGVGAEYDMPHAVTDGGYALETLTL